MLESRHRSLMILIIVLVSVFLFVSCGEPTFCELTNISIIANPDNAFRIFGTDEDLSLIEKGPGLVLCYYIADGNFDNINKKAISVFKTSSNPFLNIDSDSIVGVMSEISGEDKDFKLNLYAFKNGNTVPGSPVYNMDLSSYVSGYTLNAEFTNSSIDWENKTFTITDKDSNSFVFSFDYSEESISVDSSIVILAAFTSGVGNFSTYYWSSLKQVGQFTYQSE